jgi:hypothetical protein
MTARNMKHRIPFLCRLTFSLIVIALCMALQPAIAAKPNILIIYADDIG